MYPYRSLQNTSYDRDKALAYARQWALKRNPAYYDFEFFGGDCTNFVSQILFAGSGVMNFTPVYGWYYINSYKRTPSWTGVDFLYDFLVKNPDSGPFAQQVDEKETVPGDIIQLSFDGGGRFNHSLAVIGVGEVPDPGNILVATHTYDRYGYPISEYSWEDIRFLHILGVRK